MVARDGLSSPAGNGSMEREPTLLIEFGAFHRNSDGATPGVFNERANQTKRLAEALGSQHNITIIPVAYEGLPSTGAPFRNTTSRLCGGRGCRLTPENIDAFVAANVRFGLPTMIAANGGLLIDSERLTIGAPEKTIEGHVAESLQRNTESEVTNSLTVTLPNAQREFSRQYPGVRTIASCIRFTVPSEANSYDAAFRMSHAVVPMPQDFRRRDFLHMHRSNVCRMMPMLNLPCANPNRRKCYLHYLRLEALAKGVPQALLDEPLRLQEHLRSGAFPSICESKHDCLIEASRYSKIDNAGRAICQGKQASDDPKLLESAIRAGVWQFKLARSSHARGHPLESKEATTLIEVFVAARRRVSVQVPKE